MTWSSLSGNSRKRHSTMAFASLVGSSRRYSRTGVASTTMYPGIDLLVSAGKTGLTRSIASTDGKCARPYPTIPEVRGAVRERGSPAEWNGFRPGHDRAIPCQAGLHQAGLFQAG